MAGTGAALGLGALGLGTSIAGAFLGAGDKVKVPDYTPVDVGSTQKKTTSANLANLPNAEKLAAGVNMFNQQQLEQMLSMQIPGYKEMMTAGAKQINDLIAGKLPSDVQSSVLRSANAKALAGGWGSGGMKGNLALRDLGLTSLQATEKGLSSAMSWLQMAKSVSVAPQFDVSNQLLSAQFGVSSAINENQFKWGVDMAKAQAEAQADPFMAGLGGIMSGLGGITAGIGAQGIVNQMGWMPKLGGFSANTGNAADNQMNYQTGR